MNSFEHVSNKIDDIYKVSYIKLACFSTGGGECFSEIKEWFRKIKSNLTCNLIVSRFSCRFSFPLHFNCHVRFSFWPHCVVTVFSNPDSVFLIGVWELSLGWKIQQQHHVA